MRSVLGVGLAVEFHRCDLVCGVGSGLDDQFFWIGLVEIYE